MAPRCSSSSTPLDRENAFMLLEPGERTSTVGEEEARLARLLSHPSSTVLVAAVGPPLAGYVEAEGGTFRRERHRAVVVMGVRAEFSGRGIGKRLLDGLERWAQTAGVHRLELTVMAHNEQALALYRRVGFTAEGTRRDAIRLSGGFVDELWMAKLVPPERPPPVS
jgi:ribosomal protein S18 acetylase RimI-like enzyme